MADFGIARQINDSVGITATNMTIGTVTYASLRDLPLPTELATALQELKDRQQDEARAFGSQWSDDRLIAVREDGTPVRHEWYSDEFQRLRDRAGLRRITSRASAIPASA